MHRFRQKYLSRRHRAYHRVSKAARMAAEQKLLMAGVHVDN